MAESLSDIHTRLQQALECGDELRLTLEPVSWMKSIYDDTIHITPLWKQRKEAEIARKNAEAERERKRIEAEIALKTQRQQLGVGEPVDLGLSVLWSSRNIGAPSGDQPGYYVGWGDVTAQNASTVYDDYPCIPNISGSQYDIARTMWRETWRIPTLQEMSELMQKCQWMWTVINGVPGFQVIGSTQKSIFLPAGGDRYGMQYEDAYYYGRYWTADIFQEETARACFLEFCQGNAQISSMARYMGMLVRPVLEKREE